MSEKNEYIEKVKARLDQWNAEIDKMTAKLGEVEADTKIEYQKQLDKMHAKRDEANDKLKEIREASDDAWDDMKAGFDLAWDSLSGAFESAKGRFK